MPRSTAHLLIPRSYFAIQARVTRRGLSSVRSCLVTLKMKAITAAMCATGASVPAISNGRVQRHRDGENAEIQMYLSKLRNLVPFMPKNRRISRLEVIQNVIDYICDLQSALENHPAVGQFEAEAALTPSCTSPAKPRRSPLGPRPAPNTILPAERSPASAHHIVQQQHTEPEKLDQDRPGSC